MLKTKKADNKKLKKMQNANIREVKTRDTNTIGKSPIGQISEILLVTAVILFLSSAVSADVGGRGCPIIVPNY